MKLAILDADTLYDTLQARYVSYGQMFRHLLHDAGGDWEISIYRVIDGEYPEDPAAYHGFLITGSKYDSFADDDWIVTLRRYVQALYQRGKLLVGVCFGHQLLAHALGGRAGRSDAGWGLGVMRYQLEAHPGFADEQFSSVELIASHQDQVLALPEQAQRLLSNDFCPNAGFYIPGRVLAIQPHPEFSAEYAKALLDLRAEQLPAALVERARASLEASHDGLRVGKWIRNFMEHNANK